MATFDSRIFKVVFTYEDTQLTLDGGLTITASGMKYANALQNECQLTVSNLKKDTRDRLMTQLTPYNYDQKRKGIEVYAGRESTGLYLLYKGDITQCYPSQPPDIVLHIRSMALAWYKLNYVAQSYNVTTPLSKVVNGIGQTLGLSVKFLATDKNISNYSYSGCAAKEINHVAGMGFQVYEDNGVLVCKDRSKGIGDAIEVSQETGMVGIPELTEYGVKIKTMLNPNVSLGGKINLISNMNPLLNGEYTTYQIGFEIASRDTPFYSLIFASKYPILYGIANMPGA